MPFDNFFKENDKSNFRFGLIAIAVFILMLVGFWFWIFSIIPEEWKTAEQNPPRNSIIRVDKARRHRVEQLCSNLPRPEKFQFADKEIIVEDENLTLVRYTFKSVRKWNEIMPTFLVWLNANDWKSLPNNQETFAKENQKIAFSTISGNSANSPNFEIYCSEKPSEGNRVSFRPEDF